MTQEEKHLLLKDLSARLSYGVICQFIWSYNNETTNGEDVIAKENDSIRCIDIHTKEIRADYYDEWVDLEHCKPYLRPMSSMTEDEINEYENFITNEKDDRIRFCNELVFYNRHHFDYHGLIPLGLALPATEGMYNIK